MFNRIAVALEGPIRAFRERFDRSSINSVESLIKFVHTRSAFISQTTMHGYLKTRMGTQFRQLFEDDVFARSIRIASIRLFASSAADLAIFAAATSGRDEALTPEEMQVLARRCFQEAVRRCLEIEDLKHLPSGAYESFEERTRATAWANAAKGENAFRNSPEDLVRYAPVVDEYKELDHEFVVNSMRFRWRDVREQLRKRIDAPALSADFRSARA